jgi:hypothetical protein
MTKATKALHEMAWKKKPVAFMKEMANKLDQKAKAKIQESVKTLYRESTSIRQTDLTFTPIKTGMLKGAEQVSAPGGKSAAIQKLAKTTPGQVGKEYWYVWIGKDPKKSQEFGSRGAALDFIVKQFNNGFIPQLGGSK